MGQHYRAIPEEPGIFGVWRQVRMRGCWLGTRTTASLAKQLMEHQTLRRYQEAQRKALATNISGAKFILNTFSCLIRKAGTTNVFCSGASRNFCRMCDWTVTRIVRLPGAGRYILQQ